MKFGHKSKQAPQSASALLASKTFLQALDPEERWKLLNESNSGRQGALVPASWLGAMNLSHGSQQPQAPSSVKQMQLRIHAAAAVADSQHLLQENRCLAEDNVLLQKQTAQLHLHLNDLAERLRLGTNDRIETLELTVSSLRAAVADVAGLAHRVTRDNHQLTAQAQELAADRDQKAREAAQLKLRVHELEQHVLAGLAAASTEAAATATLAGNPLSALLTGEPLCAPAAAAFAAAAAASEAALGGSLKASAPGPLMAENGALRQARDKLDKKVGELQAKLARSEAATRAAEAAATTERAAASRALATAQQKLTAAGKRINGLGDLLKQAQEELKEKHTYIRKLEARLLHQHQKLTHAAAAVAGGSSSSPGARTTNLFNLTQTSSSSNPAAVPAMAAGVLGAGRPCSPATAAGQAQLQQHHQQEADGGSGSGQQPHSRPRSPLAYPLIDEIAADLAAADEYQAWRLAHVVGQPAVLHSVLPAAAGDLGRLHLLRQSVGAAELNLQRGLPHQQQQQQHKQVLDQQVRASLERRSRRPGPPAAAAEGGSGKAEERGRQQRSASAGVRLRGRGQTAEQQQQQQVGRGQQVQAACVSNNARLKWPGQGASPLKQRIGWGTCSAGSPGAEQQDMGLAAAAAEAMPAEAPAEGLELLQQVADLESQLLGLEGQLQGFDQRGDSFDQQQGGCKTASPHRPPGAPMPPLHGSPPAGAASKREGKAAAAGPVAAVRRSSSTSSSRLAAPPSVRETRHSSSSSLRAEQKQQQLPAKARGPAAQRALEQLRQRQQQQLQQKAAAAAAAAVHRCFNGDTGSAAEAGTASRGEQDDCHSVGEPLCLEHSSASTATLAAAAAGWEGAAARGSQKAAQRLASVQEKLAAKVRAQQEALWAQRQQLQRERSAFEDQVGAAAAGSLQQQPSRQSVDPMLVEDFQVEVAFLNDLEASKEFAALESDPAEQQQVQGAGWSVARSAAGSSSASAVEPDQSPVPWQQAARLSSPSTGSRAGGRSNVATPVPAAVALRDSRVSPAATKGFLRATATSSSAWQAPEWGPQESSWQAAAQEEYDSCTSTQQAAAAGQQLQPGSSPGAWSTGSATGSVRKSSSWRAYMQEQQEWQQPDE